MEAWLASLPEEERVWVSSLPPDAMILVRMFCSDRTAPTPSALGVRGFMDWIAPIENGYPNHAEWHQGFWWLHVRTLGYLEPTDTMASGEIREAYHAVGQYVEPPDRVAEDGTAFDMDMDGSDDSDEP
jgi:hypothetical protein